ncbi:MAG: hypothetical protein AAGA90_01400 [Actinomycetota bacterium]
MELLLDRPKRKMRDAIEKAALSIQLLPELGMRHAANVADDAAEKMMCAAGRLAEKGRADDARQMLAAARPSGCEHIDHLMASVVDQTLMSIRKA